VDPLALVGVALLFLGGKKSPSGSSSGGGGAAAAASGAPDAKWAADDGTKLHARANQQAALAWAPIFMDAGATPMEAQAMARWAGLESSGNPHPNPPGNGGGLMQVGKGFVDMGALTPGEYAKLTNPTTSNREQAVLALKYVRWLWSRAKQYVQAPPSNPVDQIWYAYLYHMRPVDVRDGNMHGEAGPMAAELYPIWSVAKQPLHRLHAANVVAFDHPGGAFE
jgi:hypothetical protein